MSGMTTEQLPSIDKAPRPLRESTSEEIRSLMARRRLTGVTLANRIGRSQSYVSRRLTGDTAFDVDDLERIASVLGVGVRDLLPGVNRDVINALGHAGDNPRDRPPNRPAGRSSGPGRSSTGNHQFVPRIGTTGPRSRSLSR